MTTSTINAHYISDKLGGKRSGKGYLAPCPVCGKTKLSINDGNNGKPLVHCWVCGTDGQQRIISALQGQGLWPNTDKKLSQQELKSMRDEAEQYRAQHEKDKAASQAKAATRAKEILAAATGDPKQHPYAILKGLPLGDRIKCGPWSQRKWTEALLIPLYDKDHNITTISAINTDGTKDLLADGKMKGSLFPIGKITDSAKVLIGEGWATMAACHVATGRPCVVAVNAGNLKDVAVAIRQMAAPGAEIIIIADDDQATEGNPGKTAAMAAAKAIGGKVAIPTMGKKADAWDVWEEQGAAAVKKMIEAAVIVGSDESETRHRAKSQGNYNLDDANDDIQRLRGALATIPADAKVERHTAEMIVGWGLRHNNSEIETHIGAALCEEWDNRTGGKSQEVFTKSDPDYDHGKPVTKASIYALAIQHGWKARGGGPPEPLPDDLFPVAEFDYRLLPETLVPWTQDICERVQCPPDFVAAGIMASLAAVVGRKIGVRPQEKTDWTVTPNLWALAVGRPGVLKSPALEAALAPLNRLVAQTNKEYEIISKEFKVKQMASLMRVESVKKSVSKTLSKDPHADVLSTLAGCLDEDVEPTLKRYKTNDSTPASLGELLRQNQNGLLVYRDEMVSLLKGLDREDQVEGRGFYLTGWNGDSPYTFDRIGRGMNLHIDAVCISLLGGTQPGRLSEYISQAVKGGAADDGLIQRFSLMVWPDTGGPWQNVDRWPDTDAKNKAFEVFDYLDKLDPAKIGAHQDIDIDGNPDHQPYLRFDKAGLELFLEWRTDLETRLREGDLHPAMESHLAKYRKLIPALALILHLADYGNGPITERAVLQSLGWGDYLETHAKRAYGAVSQQAGVTTAKTIIKRIRKGDLPTGFSSRDVWRPKWTGLTDREQVNSGLGILIEYGWLWSEQTETGGRPATVYHRTEGWPT